MNNIVSYKSVFMAIAGIFFLQGCGFIPSSREEGKSRSFPYALLKLDKAFRSSHIFPEKWCSQCQMKREVNGYVGLEKERFLVLSQFQYISEDENVLSYSVKKAGLFGRDKYIIRFWNCTDEILGKYTIRLLKKKGERCKSLGEVKSWQLTTVNDNLKARHAKKYAVSIMKNFVFEKGGNALWLRREETTVFPIGTEFIGEALSCK